MNTSYWLAQTAAKHYPKLQADQHVHIAIVGGGLCGLTTAYYLSSITNNVVVLEADTIGFGASGRNTGKLTALHGAKYVLLEKHHGGDVPSIYYQMQKEAIDAVEGIIEKHGIACGFERCSAITFTTEKENVAQLQDEYQCCLDHQIPVHYLEKSESFVKMEAGLEMKHQAKYDPYRYVLGLADVLTEKGIDVYEHSAVTSLNHKENGYELHVGDHCVFAQHVVLATQAPIFDHMGLFFAKTYPEVSHLAMINTMFESNAMYINIDDPLTSYRKIDDHALLCGGYAHPCAEMNPKDENQWLNDLKKRFTVSDIPYEWSSQDWISHDHLPFIGPISKKENHLYVAYGFGKWGNTFANIAGKLICSMILKEPMKHHELFACDRMSSLFTTKSIKINLETVKKLLMSKVKTLQDLSSSNVRVFTMHHHKYGYYRDEDGQEYIVDLTCPHMGCTLQFNEVENTWDCPCHGSRFTCFGEPIKGPANTALSTDTDVLNSIDPHIIK